MANFNRLRDQFVTYEIGRKVKKLGYNESCFGWYVVKGLRVDETFVEKRKNNQKPTLSDGYILAPLWQQVIDWLLIKYNINIVVLYDFNVKKWNYIIYLYDNNHILEHSDRNLDNKISALKAAIENVLSIVESSQ